MEAHGGVADVRRPGPQCAGAPGSQQLWGRGRRVRCQRAGRQFPGFPAGLCGGVRRPRSRARGQGGPPAQAGAGRGRQRRGAGARRAHHPAPGSLHRGVPSKGPGRTRGGAPFHLRHDHGHGAEPGLCLEEGHGPGAVLDGVRSCGPTRAVLRQAGRLWLHGADGRGPRRHRPRRRGASAVADPLLFRPAGGQGRRRGPQADGG